MGWRFKPPVLTGGPPPRKIVEQLDSLTEGALGEVLKEEDNRIIWNALNNRMDLRIKDPRKFDFDHACSYFSGEDLEICQTFFEDLRREYVKELIERRREDPVTKFLIEEISSITSPSFTQYSPNRSNHVSAIQMDKDSFSCLDKTGRPAATVQQKGVSSSSS